MKVHYYDVVITDADDLIIIIDNEHSPSQYRQTLYGTLTEKFLTLDAGCGNEVSLDVSDAIDDLHRIISRGASFVLASIVKGESEPKKIWLCHAEMKLDQSDDDNLSNNDGSYYSGRLN